MILRVPGQIWLAPEWVRSLSWVYKKPPIRLSHSSSSSFSGNASTARLPFPLGFREAQSVELNLQFNSIDYISVWRLHVPVPRSTNLPVFVFFSLALHFLYFYVVYHIIVPLCVCLYTKIESL